ncbi:ABC transporter permease [Streptomyces sp. NPDC019396]|uniref:ABC transporter permease n=1 Tax=Streptomyces sp. NPDC019396 TaxID=3154687 RepID=UPI0033DE7C23
MSTHPLTGPARSLFLPHRRALLLFGAFVALSAAGLIALRLIGADNLEQLSGDSPLSSWAFDFGYGSSMSSAATAIAWLPLPVAFFAGAALFGAELERGTAQLTWTQSAVTPARWLAVKLGVTAAVFTVGAGLLSLLYRWDRNGGEKVLSDEWYHTDVFLALGPTAIAYGLFALATGALAGLLLRRAVAAGSVTFGATAFVMLFAESVRDRLWPVQEVVWRLSRGELADSAWQQGSGLVVNGARVPQCWTPDSIHPAGCHSGRGVREWYAVFHPPSHFWPIQLIETGIVLALTAAVTYAAFRALRTRHG